MIYVKAVTTVDITNSGVRRISESNKKEYHQQQNFNVLLQTIGLRTQVFDPQIEILDNTKFPNEFGGDKNGRLWILTFYVENDKIWLDKNDELFLLKQDVHGVAFTSDLDNTVDFKENVFDTKDNINIMFLIDRTKCQDE